MLRTFLAATAIALLGTSVSAQITQMCFPGTDPDGAGPLPTTHICPCPSQAPSNPSGGCANHGIGATSGAVLNASGTASVGADMSSATLFLTTSNHRIVSIGVSNLFFSYKPGGATPTSGLISGAGVRCTGAGGSYKRLYFVQIFGGTLTKPAVGDPSVSVRSATLPGPLQPIVPPETRYYFNVYRDGQAGLPPNCNNPLTTTNVTNMVSVVWTP